MSIKSFDKFKAAFLSLTIFVSLLFLLSGSCVRKQTGEEKAIITVVEQFFHALASKDSSAARAVMEAEGRFYSVREDGTFRTQTHQQFFESIATEESDFLERMWNPEILIHGRIAVLWTPYDFHRNDEFSHCGVDAFSLIKTQQGWKIAGTIYSIQRTGCSESPLGPPKGTM